MTCWFDVSVSCEQLRQRLYAGDLIGYHCTDPLARLGRHARTCLQEAFGALDPRNAQFELPVEEYVRIMAPFKPRFMHHPLTRSLVIAVLESLGCDMDNTYLDVPRFRCVTSSGYLTSGVGYVHHPHRDTWYAAPFQQINWWMPVGEICAENTIAVHPYYWNSPVPNSSDQFNYYHWNSIRGDASKHIKSDARPQPRATTPLDRLEPSFRFVVPQDSLVVFSAAQLHSTVPNTSGVTRYSIDFRTIHFQDVLQHVGARNIDSHPRGTSLRDFLHVRTGEPLPAEIVSEYDNDEDSDGVLVFQPPALLLSPDLKDPRSKDPRSFGEGLSN